ncbi:MAG: hypothetical protein HY897_07985 [Deltaproteobacteria bacterium]|nr:hypothetical protein [Deltaproteobacteria bacterium]
MPFKHDVVVKRIADRGEELIGKITNQVLGNEKFLAALQIIITQALATKSKVDKNVQHALSSLNLPSTADFEKIGQKIGDLEEMLDGISDRLKAVEKKLDRFAEKKDS